MMKYLTSQVLRLREFLAYRTGRQSGDTMIEVLACIAVIGIALAGGYALSSHSLRTGVDASRRSGALSLGQGQVEFLKNALVNKTTDAYTSAPQPFCINDTNGAVINGTTACQAHFNPYNIAITYDSDKRVFTIKPSWTGNSSSGASELSLYYKFPESFTPIVILPPPPPPAPPGPPPPPPVAPTASTSNPSGITRTGATFNSQINPNGSATSYYFQYSTCTAKTDPGPSGGQRTDGCTPNSSGWSATASQSAGSGTSSANYSQLISGLQPHTAYLYRVIAVNAGGTVTNTGLLTPAQLNSFPPMVPCGGNMCAQGTESFWTPS